MLVLLLLFIVSIICSASQNILEQEAEDVVDSFLLTTQNYHPSKYDDANEWRRLMNKVLNFITHLDAYDSNLGKDTDILQMLFPLGFSRARYHIKQYAGAIQSSSVREVFVKQWDRITSLTDICSLLDGTIIRLSDVGDGLVNFRTSPKEKSEEHYFIIARLHIAKEQMLRYAYVEIWDIGSRQDNCVMGTSLHKLNLFLHSQSAYQDFIFDWDLGDANPHMLYALDCSVRSAYERSVDGRFESQALSYKVFMDFYRSFMRRFLPNAAIMGARTVTANGARAIRSIECVPYKLTKAKELMLVFSDRQRWPFFEDGFLTGSFAQDPLSWSTTSVDMPVIVFPRYSPPWHNSHRLLSLRELHDFKERRIQHYMDSLRRAQELPPPGEITSVPPIPHNKDLYALRLVPYRNTPKVGNPIMIGSHYPPLSRHSFPPSPPYLLMIPPFHTVSMLNAPVQEGDMLTAGVPVTRLLG